MLKATYKSISGVVFFSVEGLSLERLINQCTQDGIRIYGLRRLGPKSLRGSVSVSDYGKLEEIAEQRGWKLKRISEKGGIRMKRFFFRRALLWSGALVFLAMGIAALSCVWKIDIQNAGAYRGEILRILDEHEIEPGRFFFTLQTDALQEDITRQLPGLSWVGVNRSGVTLQIRCVQAFPGVWEEESYGSLYAQKSGIIESVVVHAGTAVVHAGDAVFRGQELIRGEERAFGEAITQVQAKGSVQARVWVQAQAQSSLEEILSVPTGKTEIRSVLCLGNWEYAITEPPAYETWDMDITQIRLGGMLPLWLRRETYIEVETRMNTRNLEQTIAETEEIALRLAMEKVPNDAQILDKWTEYSMIKDGYVCATAVIETLEEIAGISN